jgi:hypothetical protein
MLECRLTPTPPEVSCSRSPWSSPVLFIVLPRIGGVDGITAGLP